jgi:hypothetical protein
MTFMSELVCNFVNDLKFDTKVLSSQERLGSREVSIDRPCLPAQLLMFQVHLKGPWRFKRPKKVFFDV